jgi:hypothetical protein
MVHEAYYNKEGELICYTLTGEDRIKFEVVISDFNGRITNIESHVQDQKYCLNKISDEQDRISQKQAAMFEYIHNWMASVGTEVRKIAGVPGGKGLEARVCDSEANILVLQTSIKVWARMIVFGLPLMFTAIEIVFKFLVR